MINFSFINPVIKRFNIEHKQDFVQPKKRQAKEQRKERNDENDLNDKDEIHIDKYV